MNISRAKEIAASPVMQHVTLNGQEIYIQHVDEQTATARVFPIGEPEKEKTVPVDRLQEEQ